MRIREILIEDYNGELDSSLANILIGIKSKGITTVRTDIVVGMLQKQGYSVSVDSIIELLSDAPYVFSITPEEITLVDTDTSVDDTGISDGESSADHVSQLAQTASYKDLK